MYVHVLPATRWLTGPAISALGICCASGGTPGQMAIWVCPGDGCQVKLCAPTGLDAATRQMANRNFIVSRRSLMIKLRLKVPGASNYAASRGFTTWLTRQWVRKMLAGLARLSYKWAAHAQRLYANSPFRPA